MIEIGKRIAAARESAGLNQSELARRLGVSPQSVQKWESTSGGAPRHERLAAISSALGVSVSYLLGESNDAAETVSGYMIPSLPVEQARPDVFNGRLTLSEGFVSTYLRVKSIDRLRYTQATGGAMSPTIEDGDVLLIDTSDCAVSGDGVYVISINGSASVRRITQRLDGLHEVTCDSSTMRGAGILEHVDSVSIVGRVAWVWRGLRP